MENEKDKLLKRINYLENQLATIQNDLKKLTAFNNRLKELSEKLNQLNIKINAVNYCLKSELPATIKDYQARKEAYESSWWDD